MKIIYLTQEETAAPAAPTAPNTLVATAGLAEPEIVLTWAGPSTTETGFKIERSLDAGATWTRIAIVSANVLTYTDEGLDYSTTYHYRVRAFRARSHSAYSNTANATTRAAPSAGAALNVFGLLAIANNDLTPSALDGTDIGNVPQNSVKNVTYILYNTGDADVVISAIALPAAGYTRTAPAALPVTIPPSTQINLTLSLTTTAPGVLAGNIVITSNVAAFTFAITATIVP